MNYVKVTESRDVYPPQEDTWFLTDILIRKLKRLNSSKAQKILICEIGVGTGFISVVLGKKFPNVKIIGVDISLNAVKLCQQNMREHLPPLKYRLICSNILDAFNPLKFFPDIIFFNPPYVRTNNKEFTSNYDIKKAWAGGPQGISIIMKFLEMLTQYEFKQAYFVSTSLNENEIFENKYKNTLKIEITSTKKVGDETLLCYIVYKPNY